jgi:glycosyltransferase involved in cell wall biosynthesis
MSKVLDQKIVAPSAVAWTDAVRAATRTPRRNGPSGGPATGPLHILFLSHYFPPEVNAPATRTYEHCRRWVAAGHRVTVITCAPNCPTGVVAAGYKNALLSREWVDGIRVLRVWTWLSPNKGFLGRTINYLSYMLCATICALGVRKVDAIVATSPQFFCGWAGVLCRWLLRRPLLLEIRDIWPESIVTVGAMKRSPVMRVLEVLERWMYATARQIVTVGDGYRDQLIRRGAPEEKIAVVPNGVDVSQFVPQPRSRPLRARWRGEGRFVCAYIGTVGMAHGLDVIVRAARKLKQAGGDDVVFWIVGDGAERGRLESECRAEGLDQVVFTGLVPKSQIAEVIASCDACLVHLRKTELFETVIPSKIFEIMAMNVPIVMGVRGQAQRIVLTGQAGVAMTPEDEESLLAAIETVARDRASFSRGRDYVARHFDRDVLAHRLLDELVAITTPTPATIPFPAPVLAEPATAATGDAPLETAPERRAAA